MCETKRSNETYFCCFESGLTGVLSDYFQSLQGLMRQSQRISNWIL